MARNDRGPWWVRALLVVLMIAAVVLGALLMTVTASSWGWIAFASLSMAVLGLVSVPSAGRTEFTPAYVVAASLPFIAQSGEGEAVQRVFDSPSIIAVVAFGIVGLSVLRLFRRDDPMMVNMGFIKRALAFTAYLGGYLLAARLLTTTGLEDEAGVWRAAILFVFAAAAAFVVEIASSAVLRFQPGGRASIYFAFETARDLPIYLSLVATGALFGLAYQTILWGAFILAALPYAFAHAAFRRFEQAKTAYRQTIQALAQIPEVGGHTDPGHARRTADLAVAIATEMGLRPSEVESTEYAAYLHDIGRVSLNEPSVLRMGFTENDIARWGAEIVGETPYLSDVADVVRRQYEPFRTPGDGGDPNVPVAAKIVKVASAYDESSVELGFSPLEAMDRLHRGAAYDYDPEVVSVLRMVLDRRGVFHPLSRA